MSPDAWSPDPDLSSTFAEDKIAAGLDPEQVVLGA